MSPEKKKKRKSRDSQDLSMYWLHATSQVPGPLNNVNSSESISPFREFGMGGNNKRKLGQLRIMHLSGYLPCFPNACFMRA